MVDELFSVDVVVGKGVVVDVGLLDVDAVVDEVVVLYVVVVGSEVKSVAGGLYDVICDGGVVSGDVDAGAVEVVWCFLYGEVGDGDVVCKNGDDFSGFVGVDDGGGFVVSLEMELFVYGDVFVVGAVVDVDGVSVGCVIDCVLYEGVVVWSGSSDIKGVSQRKDVLLVYALSVCCCLWKCYKKNEDDAQGGYFFSI